MGEARDGVRQCRASNPRASMARKPLIVPALLAALSMAWAAPAQADDFKLTPAATPERVGECLGIILAWQVYSDSVNQDMGADWRRALERLRSVARTYDQDALGRAQAARHRYDAMALARIERVGKTEGARAISADMGPCAELFYED